MGPQVNQPAVPLFSQEHALTSTNGGGIPSKIEMFLREHRHELFAPWWNDAACSGLDTEVWFSERRGPTGHDSVVAVSICRMCPVKNECLDWAMRVGEQYGIYGGMFPDERRALKEAANADPIHV